MSLSRKVQSIRYIRYISKFSILDFKKDEIMNNVKIFTDNIESQALNQVEVLASQPAFKDCKIRIMPDVHAGKGCVIGFTADLGDKLIPNIVGVDIGCGMLTVKLGDIDLNYGKLDKIIRKHIPSGRNVHDGRTVRFDKLKDLHCYRELKNTKRIERSIGSLGGGNHFIEVGKDDDNNKYLVIHTGSRNLGKQVADYYQKLAIELMQGKGQVYERKEQIIKEYKESGKKDQIQKAIKKLNREFRPKKLDIPKDLCYLTGRYREEYLHDMKICQEYADFNRETIMNLILDNYGLTSLGHFTTIHNYIDHETNIVRKGAISAKKDEIVLIPINMRDGCIIGRGLGNDDWNQSAPHGAGRLMSRTQAKKTLNLNDFHTEMDGIYTTSVNSSTLDEAPMAYKPIEEILDNIGDTVEVIKIIKPVYNFKAS